MGSVHVCSQLLPSRHSQTAIVEVLGISVDILVSIPIAAQREIFAISITKLYLYSERRICVYAVDEKVFAVRKLFCVSLEASFPWLR